MNPFILQMKKDFGTGPKTGTDGDEKLIIDSQRPYIYIHMGLKSLNWAAKKKDNTYASIKNIFFPQTFQDSEGLFINVPKHK